MPAWERSIARRREHRIHQLEGDPRPYPVDQRFQTQIACYEGAKQRKRAYDAESSGPSEQYQNKADGDPEDPVLSEHGY